MKGIDIGLEAFDKADGDPERAIGIARKWVVTGGREGMTEAEFKRLIVNRIWELRGELDEA